MSSLLAKFSGSTRRITFGLSSIQLIKAFLSFFTVIISSAYFGTSLGRDIWLLSLSIFAIVGTIMFGPIFEIFRVKFVMIRESVNEGKALSATCSLLIYMLIFTVLIVLVAEIIPVILGRTFAPTYSSEQQEKLMIMIRFIAPTLMFTVIISILTGLLNVYNIFYIPEIMSIISSLLNVFIIILFTPSIGIYSLVISGYLSNIILLTVLIVVLQRNNIFFLRNINLNFKYVREFLRFALPYYFNYVIAQFLIAVERVISTVLGIGSLAILDYARKFVSIPIGVIQSTVNAVLTTKLAKIYIQEGDKEFILEMNKYIDMMLLVTLPMMTIFIICPLEIVKVFLLRGAFHPQFVEPTAKALFWFGFSIIAIIYYSTNSQALLAKGKIKTAASVSGSLGFVVLAINLTFYKKYGIQVLAFSWTIGHLLAGITMYFLISKYEIKMLIRAFIKKVLILFMTLLISYFTYFLLTNLVFVRNSFFNNLKILFSIGIISIVSEILLIYLLKFNESIIITRYLEIIKLKCRSII